MPDSLPEMLFDTEHEYGAISTLVLLEHDNEENKNFDLESAKLRFIAADCPNAASVLDWAIHNVDHERFGLGTIYESDLVEEMPKDRENSDLGMLYFGNPDFDISPVSWLVFLSRRVHELSIDDRARFDMVCSDVMLLYDEPPEALN